MNKRIYAQTTLESYEEHSIELEIELYDLAEQRNIDYLDAFNILVDKYEIEADLLISVLSNPLKIGINLIKYPSEAMTPKQSAQLVQSKISEAILNDDRVHYVIGDLIEKYKISTSNMLSWLGYKNRKHLRSI